MVCLFPQQEWGFPADPEHSLHAESRRPPHAFTPFASADFHGGAGKRMSAPGYRCLQAVPMSDWESNPCRCQIPRRSRGSGKEPTQKEELFSQSRRTLLLHPPRAQERKGLGSPTPHKLWHLGLSSPALGPLSKQSTARGQQSPHVCSRGQGWS
jgi:hypothetical protein